MSTSAAGVGTEVRIRSVSIPQSARKMSLFSSLTPAYPVLRPVRWIASCASSESR